MESKNLISHKEFLAATRRARRKQATTPMAVAVRYNKRANRVVISLSTKVEVMFNPSDVQGLENATPAQLAEIEITPSGFGLYFPQVDADICPEPSRRNNGLSQLDGRPPRSRRRKIPQPT